MLRRKEISGMPGKTAHSQCRLCLNYASEFCSLANRLEDMRTVQEVIKMLLSIEDDPGLPQQICSSCSKELLHMARLKDCWVANQFRLARQAPSVVPEEQMGNQCSDTVQFQPDDHAKADENVSNSEFIFVKDELVEFTTEQLANVTDRAKTNNGCTQNDGTKKTGNCFRCSKCRISFPTLKLKTEHVKMHNICETCGATFRLQNYLRRHMVRCQLKSQRKHYGERQSPCYQRISRMDQEEEHIKMQETVESHACLLCTKNFTDQQQLIRHKREAHSNIRRTQRQKATKVERLPFEGESRTIRQSDGDVQGSVKEDLVDDDYELIID